MTTLQSLGPWLVRPQPQPGARLRLLCFPYAGGGASIYRTWPKSLPPTIELWAIQFPGRETRFREPRLTSLEPLIHQLAELLTPHLTLPFACFGHSMGALISFELTRRLRAQGGPQPLHLLVSARRAPQLPRSRPLTYNLPDAEFIAELRRLSGTPEEVLRHQELLELMMPLLRADLQINETYQYQPGVPLDCPISVFGGLEDTTTPPAELPPWQEQTRAAFKLRMFPGGHFFLNKGPLDVIRAVTQDLTPYLG